VPRVRLTLEYDGTDFFGFQFQASGERTVQSVLETALNALTKDSSARIFGAGRTDAGVHALGQVAHFDVDWRIPEDKIATAINVNLPPDLVVRSAEIAPNGFHSRFDATSRTYRYVILNQSQRSALLGRYSWFVPYALSVEKMQAAAVRLIGLNDYAAFGTAQTEEKSTVRLMSRIEVRRWKQCLLITVRGNAFLRQMVRALVGTLVAAGQGHVTPSEVTRILESRDRQALPPIAPARGLCLVRVGYDGVRLT
jgi:tRNA pseudouridine38-40 synthase